MPFGGLLSLGTAAISGGSALAGLFGGSPASKVPTPQVNSYNYANMGGADQGAYGGIGGLGQWNVPGQLLPQYMDIAQQSVNNPYAAMYQQGANQAGATGVQSGMNAFNAGGQMTGNSMGMMPDVQGLLSLGFDPQQALYQRMAQQTQDQSRASQSARGIQTTPYGAGLENDAMRNFNIDWQNNQLGRAAQGAGAAGTLFGQIGQGVQTGQGLQAGAMGQMQQGYGMPYSTFQNINADALNVLSGAGGFGTSAAGIPQQQIQDYLSYLQGGNSAMQTGNAGQLGLGQFGLNQAQQGFSQNQQLGQNLGSSLAGLAKNWPSGGFGGSSAVPQTAGRVAYGA